MNQTGSGRGSCGRGWIGEDEDATDGGARKKFETAVCLRVEEDDCGASKSNG